MPVGLSLCASRRSRIDGDEEREPIPTGQYWMHRNECEAYTRETDAAVTAFWLCGDLLEVVVYKTTTGCLDDTTAVRGGVVRLTLAEGDTLGHCSQCLWFLRWLFG